MAKSNEGPVFLELAHTRCSSIEHPEVRIQITFHYDSFPHPAEEHISRRTRAVTRDKVAMTDTIQVYGLKEALGIVEYVRAYAKHRGSRVLDVGLVFESDEDVIPSD